MYPKLHFPLLLSISLLFGQLLADVKPKPYRTPAHCRPYEYFDVLSLSCLPCRSLAQLSYSLAPNQTEDILESSPTDRTVCVCRPGLLLDQLDGKYRCVNGTGSCPEGQVFADGDCGVCLETNTTQCGDCPRGSTLRKILQQDVGSNESSLHFTCEPTRLTVGMSPCHRSYLLASGGKGCDCPKADYEEEDGQCVPQRALLSGDTRLQYATSHFGESRFISEHLFGTIRPAVYNCNNLKNQSACHHLLNLCTLKLATELSSGDSGEEKWNLCLYLSHLNPKLDFQIDGYYVSDHRESVVPDTFRSGDTVHLVATSFASDGTFRGMSPLGLGDLFLCASARLKHETIRFGTNLQAKCVWSAADLWDFAMRQQENNQFWELHLLSGSSQLYPVPVRVSYGAETANRWMTERFFLVNSQIGVDLVRFRQKGTIRFLLYARSVTLHFQLSQHSTEGQIYPPMVQIEYAAIEAGSNRSNASLETQFAVVFQINDSRIKYNLNLAVALLSGLALLWSIFRTWTWRNRSDTRLDLSVAWIFLATTVATISNILLAVSLFFLVNQLVVFKFQSVIHTVLLTPEQESLLVVYLTVAYVLKCLHLLKEMAVNTSIDIFFLDWEKPRRKDQLESYSKGDGGGGKRFSNASNERRLDTVLEQHATPPMNNHRKTSALSGGSVGDTSANITIWRSYFIANEWCELNQKRRINLCGHICVLILLLECTDLKYFTRIIPYNGSISVSSDPKLIEEVPDSSTARIALSAILYLLLASAQYLYKKYILENLGCGKLNAFIDLCSVSNISIFCLKYRCFGYYLHGLSPNGRSDVNMLEMYGLLEMEESDLCSKRGLLPNTEQQTFEMYLPSVVADHWTSLRAAFRRSGPRPLLPRLGPGEFRDADKGKLVATYYAINRFLISFIEHSAIKADYTVQDRSGLESLLNFELEPVHGKGRLYNDGGHSFENILLYGLELTLATFELLTFLMIDLMWRNYLLAAMGTFAISKLLTVAYGKLSRQNLVNKTLMDERFLI